MHRQDWFERLTGFHERNYEETQSRLRVEGDELVSTVNNKRYGIGTLEAPTLAELRARISVPTAHRTTVRCIAGNVRVLHAEPEFEGALFQVASVELKPWERLMGDIVGIATISRAEHRALQVPHDTTLSALRALADTAGIIVDAEVVARPSRGGPEIGSDSTGEAMREPDRADSPDDDMPPSRGSSSRPPGSGS